MVTWPRILHIDGSLVLLHRGSLDIYIYITIDTNINTTYNILTYERILIFIHYIPYIIYIYTYNVYLKFKD